MRRFLAAQAFMLGMGGLTTGSFYAAGETTLAIGLGVWYGGFFVLAAAVNLIEWNRWRHEKANALKREIIRKSS